MISGAISMEPTTGARIFRRVTEKKLRNARRQTSPLCGARGVQNDARVTASGLLENPPSVATTNIEFSVVLVVEIIVAVHSRTS
jgi:hypothetical protein